MGAIKIFCNFFEKVLQVSKINPIFAPRKLNKSHTQTHNAMTHRTYKNEYNAEFLRQIIAGRIKGLCATGQESEQVIIIEGELENLQKFASLMYATPEQIKAVFPDFLTAEDVDILWKKKFSAAYEALRQAIFEGTCEDYGTSYGSEERNKMLDLWVEMKETVSNFAR